jgi:Protein of unknown function (DUF3618)
MTTSGRAGKSTPTETEAEPRDDAQELRQEIEQTREQLGETVEQLVAKADVKGRAQAKVSDLAGRAKATAESARPAVAKATDNASQRPVQLAAAAAALVAGYLIVRWWRTR